jgi:hypothetical protein
MERGAKIAAGAALGGVAVVAVVVLGVLGAAAIHREGHRRAMIAVSLGPAATSGLSADQLIAAGDAGAKDGGLSPEAAEDAAAAFASAGVSTPATITELVGSVGPFAALTRQSPDSAVAELAEVMRDPEPGIRELENRVAIVDGSQMEDIDTAMRLAEPEKARDLIAKALKDYADAATRAGLSP